MLMGLNFCRLSLTRIKHSFFQEQTFEGFHFNPLFKWFATFLKTRTCGTIILFYTDVK
jgi:hypothetical protein